MKKVYLTVMVVLSLAISSAVFGQSNNWSPCKDLGTVVVEQQTVQCTYPNSDVTAEYIFLRLTNTTNQEVHISFRIDTYFDGSCRTCGNYEYGFSFTIPANGSIEPTCAFNSANDKLAVFVKNVNRPNYASFDKFEINNVTIQ